MEQLDMAQGQECPANSPPQLQQQRRPVEHHSQEATQTTAGCKYLKPDSLGQLLEHLMLTAQGHLITQRMVSSQLF